MNVFAPTDEAFTNVPSGTVEFLLENMRDLIKVLRSCPFDYNQRGEAPFDFAQGKEGEMGREGEDF
ncbi:fasciclin domain-containing protein [Tychonema sp. LEGE 07203]|uniref:fasciclin domain-containing protein n=1 Tax=Tychonema sp. LEGE 07203 TaxID=1828671 RepID=UPI001D142DD9|nr:fasciclin domain-containing protein [Tychonema sp. LEGE 07203]